MLLPSIPALRSPRSQAQTRGFPKAAVALGVLAGLTAGAALHAVSGHLQGFVLDQAWQTAAAQNSGPLAFGGAHATVPDTKTMTVLGGVSGEVFASAGIRAAARRTAAQATGSSPLANVSPAAWDRLSAGDCITVTTKGGQTLSFRIVGAHPASEPKAETLPKIDLAVTACSGTGEPIAKAVIEPARQPAAQHSL